MLSTVYFFGEGLNMERAALDAIKKRDDFLKDHKRSIDSIDVEGIQFIPHGQHIFAVITLSFFPVENEKK